MADHDHTGASSGPPGAPVHRHVAMSVARSGARAVMDAAPQLAVIDATAVPAVAASFGAAGLDDRRIHVVDAGVRVKDPLRVARLALELAAVAAEDAAVNVGIGCADDGDRCFVIAVDAASAGPDWRELPVSATAPFLCVGAALWWLSAVLAGGNAERW